MKKILLVGLIGALFLSACAVTESIENKEEFQPTTVEEKLDVNTAVEAVESRNIDFCDTIENKDQKSECKIKVANQLTLDMAKEEVSLEKCEKITEKNTKEKCEILVKTEIERLEMIEKKKAIEKERLDIGFEASVKNDSAYCDKIEDDRNRGICKFNTVITDAIEEGDSEMCEKIEYKKYIEKCKSSMGN